MSSDNLNYRDSKVWEFAQQRAGEGNGVKFEHIRSVLVDNLQDPGLATLEATRICSQVGIHVDTSEAAEVFFD